MMSMRGKRDDNEENDDASVLGANTARMSSDCAKSHKK